MSLFLTCLFVCLLLVFSKRLLVHLQRSCHIGSNHGKMKLFFSLPWRPLHERQLAKFVMKRQDEVTITSRRRCEKHCLRYFCLEDKAPICKENHLPIRNSFTKTNQRHSFVRLFFHCRRFNGVAFYSA